MENVLVGRMVKRSKGPLDAESIARGAGDEVGQAGDRPPRGGGRRQLAEFGLDEKRIVVARGGDLREGEEEKGLSRQGGGGEG